MKLKMHSLPLSDIPCLRIARARLYLPDNQKAQMEQGGLFPFLPSIFICPRPPQPSCIFVYRSVHISCS